MKEEEFIQIIGEEIGTEFIGDDCAYLKDLGIVVSQDSLVEGVHFKREWISPYQLGYKSVAVNISDILASGAKPAYVTIALSLPKDIEADFLQEFYRGAKKALFGAKIVGGDITGSDKIFISISAIGKAEGRRISSRKNAKAGYKVISTGEYGLSALGLKELQIGGNNEKLIKAHLEPKLNEKFSRNIAEKIKVDYAMMDTSDGLADTLFKIAQASGVSIVAKDISGIFGAEDYNLVAAVPEEFLKELDEYDVIAEVLEKQDYILKIGDKTYSKYNELSVYDHFGEKEV